MSNSDEPAFPFEFKQESTCYGFGLTKREYFAAAAMNAIWIDRKSGPNDALFARVAKDAVAQADALIAELAKPIRIKEAR